MLLLVRLLVLFLRCLECQVLLLLLLECLVLLLLLLECLLVLLMGCLVVLRLAGASVKFTPAARLLL